MIGNAQKEVTALMGAVEIQKQVSDGPLSLGVPIWMQA
jgi:hypothetical protein